MSRHTIVGAGYVSACGGSFIAYFGLPYGDRYLDSATSFKGVL